MPASSTREELETTSMDARTPLLPAVVTPKQALSIKPLGLDMNVLLTTEATGGATSVIVAWHKPGEGPPDHVHFKQEEILFIIEGLYEVTVGGETAKAGPGSIVFIPRNVVHHFKNVGGYMGRMLGWSLPGGQDHYLKAISELGAVSPQQDVRYPLPCRALIPHASPALKEIRTNVKNEVRVDRDPLSGPQSLQRLWLRREQRSESDSLASPVSLAPAAILGVKNESMSSTPVAGLFRMIAKWFSWAALSPSLNVAH
jgi:quercetin dioxygenase-like cupin family protein